MERSFPADLIPCPTCLGPADFIPAASKSDFPRSRCAVGHECSLIPDVEKHLREIAAIAEKRQDRLSG